MTFCEGTPVNSKPILIVAAAARMMAESGRRGNLRLLTIDQFGDQDTLKASDRLIKAAAEDGGLSPNRVRSAIESLDPKAEAQVVLGGGLDSHPELIEHIESHRSLIGNSAERFKQLKMPERCFALFDKLGIPYPDVSWRGPTDSREWLLKTGCSEGGKGVRSAAHDQAGSGDFYQRRLAGPTYSLLFLANGDDLKIIGFNTLRTVAIGKTPFLFAGAQNFTDLGIEVRRRMAAVALKLIKNIGLVGLNSLDFMLDPQKGPLVLEINPRPSATMALYDRDMPEGLLRAHIHAVYGKLMPIPATTQFRAFHVVIASRMLSISENLIWPSWCHDRPVPGTSVLPGAPFCTVEAEASSPQSALKLLSRRIDHLKVLMAAPIHYSSFSYPV